MPNEQHQWIERAERATIVASMLGRHDDHDEPRLLAYYQRARHGAVSGNES